MSDTHSKYCALDDERPMSDTISVTRYGPVLYCGRFWVELFIHDALLQTKHFEFFQDTTKHAVEERAQARIAELLKESKPDEAE
jgi:hypothetical protein